MPTTIGRNWFTSNSTKTFVYVTQKTLFSNICSSKISTFLFIGLQKRLNIFLFFFFFFFNLLKDFFVWTHLYHPRIVPFPVSLKNTSRLAWSLGNLLTDLGLKSGVLQKFSDNSLRECHLHCIRWKNSSKYFLSSRSFK